MLNKTLKVAAGFCLMATTAWAQVQMPVDMPQVFQNVKNHYEQVVAGNIVNPMLWKNAQRVNGVAEKFTPNTISVLPKVMTRAGEFGAYYTLPSGVFNIKPGFQYGETETGEPELSRYGILAPIMEQVTYTNASTAAVNFDWFINDEVTGLNEETLHAIYVPYGNSWWTPMPELTAYAANNADSIYQYGYGFDWQKGEFVSGMAVTAGSGFVHNMEVLSESWAESLPISLTGDWSGMMFGSDTSMKPEHFEFFEKPLAPIVLNAVYLNIATPTGGDLTGKEFAVTLLTADKDNQWGDASARVTATPQKQGDLNVEGYQEFGWWAVVIQFEKPILIHQDFMLKLEGPQDGKTPWAFLFDVTRSVGGKNTAGLIPTIGEMANQMVSYSTKTSDGQPAEFPTSLDLGLYMYTPYNIFFERESGYPVHSLNNDTLAITDGGALSASLVLWNWEALNIGTNAKMTISSDSDWLKATITRGLSSDMPTYEVLFEAEACPANVDERFGTVTFTDGQGFSSTLTFYQEYDAEGIEGVLSDYIQPTIDPNAPVFDLTGRQVSAPTKGIYLQNGKKFVVK